MKFDEDPAKLSLGAQRTVTQILRALEQTLTRRDFAEVQVKEICEEAMIPRSTFYNYFEDKYDLLDYYFTFYTRGLHARFLHRTVTLDEARALLDSMLAVGEKRWDCLGKILQKNKPDGILLKKLKEELADLSFFITKQLHTYDENDIPGEIIARMNAQAVVTVVDWVFIQRHPMSREKMIDWIFTLCQ